MTTLVSDAMNRSPMVVSADARVAEAAALARSASRAPASQSPRWLRGGRASAGVRRLERHGIARRAGRHAHRQHRAGGAAQHRLRHAPDEQP